EGGLGATLVLRRCHDSTCPSVSNAASGRLYRAASVRHLRRWCGAPRSGRPGSARRAIDVSQELLHGARLVFGVLRELAAHPGSRCVTADYDAYRDGAHPIRLFFTVEKKPEKCKFVATH